MTINIQKSPNELPLAESCQAELAKLEQERFDATTESLAITKQWNESVSAALAKIAEG